LPSDRPYHDELLIERQRHWKTSSRSRSQPYVERAVTGEAHATPMSASASVERPAHGAHKSHPSEGRNSPARPGGGGRDQRAPAITVTDTRRQALSSALSLQMGASLLTVTYVAELVVAA
jgi:hypothetical protein